MPRGKLTSGVVAFLIATGTVAAGPLVPENWSKQRQATLLTWLRQVGDSSKPCGAVRPLPPPKGVRLLSSACRVVREAGKPVERDRKLKLEFQGGSWHTYPIHQVTYEQQFSLKEGLIIHSEAAYFLDATYAEAAPVIKKWWLTRGLESSVDVERRREYVEREAMVESISQTDRLTVFTEEFNE